MNGTDKQVAAAKQIINETTARIETYLAAEFGTPVPAEFGLWQVTRVTAPAFISWLCTLDDAAVIIDWLGARTRPFRTLKVIMAFKHTQAA